MSGEKQTKGKAKAAKAKEKPVKAKAKAVKSVLGRARARSWRRLSAGGGQAKRERPLSERVAELPDWRQRYLLALSEIGLKARSAKLAGVGVVTVWREKKSNPEFAVQEEEIYQGVVVPRLEDELIRRGMIGVVKPVFGSLGREAGSGIVGHVREYSDGLLTQALKANLPEKYTERRQIEGKLLLIDDDEGPGPEGGKP